MRVWQPGGHLSSIKEVEVDDWSWRRTRRRIAELARLAKPYKARTAFSVVSLLAAPMPQRVAPIGTSLRQNGQFMVVGSAGGSVRRRAISMLIGLMTKKKIAAAVSTNVINAVMNAP